MGCAFCVIANAIYCDKTKYTIINGPLYTYYYIINIIIYSVSVYRILLFIEEDERTVMTKTDRNFIVYFTSYVILHRLRNHTMSL